MFKRKISWFLSLVFFISISSAECHAELDGRKKIIGELSNFIIKNDLISNRFNKVLQHYNRLSDGQNFCINKQYSNANCIYIYIIDQSGIFNRFGNAYGSRLRRLRLNASAISPNLILIDDLWLSLVFLNIINHHIYQYKIGGDELGSLYAQASYQQFINMRRSILKDKDLIDAGFKSAQLLVDEHIGNFYGKSDNSSFDEFEKNLIVSALSLLLEHEIAHLDHNSAYYRDLSKIDAQRRTGVLSPQRYSRALQQYRLNEERRADKVALERAAVLISKQFPKNLNLDENIKDALIKWPMLGMSGLYRDRALLFGMDGFRGLSAEDITIELVHNTCNEDRKQGRANFNDPVEIMRARYRPLPVFTASEFVKARRKFISDPARITHDHYFLRAKLIENHIKKNDKYDRYWFLKTDDQINLVQALLQNNPNAAKNVADQKLFEHIESPKIQKKVRIDELLQFLRQISIVENGVTCPTSQCFVASLGKFGFIEVIGDRKYVSEVRWMFNAIEISQEEYIQYMVKMSVMFLIIGGNKLETMIEAMLAMRQPVYTCNFGSGFMEMDGRVYHSTSVNRHGWIYIRIFSQKVFKNLGME